MALDGFLFDLDGVLIDSNALHVRAWREAFRARDYDVEEDRIFAEVGKGGDKVVAHVLGQKAEEQHGDALRAAQKQGFLALARANGIAPMPGARALIEALRGRGLRLALATSSGEEQLEAAEKASQVPWRALMDEVVTAKEVEETKPAPDLVTVAVQKLDLGPGQCAMIGDTPWDAAAAASAGVTLVGLTGAGNDAARLRAGGARALARDPADVSSRLDDVLRELSPHDLHLSHEQLAGWMTQALTEAQAGFDAGEVPVGALLLGAEGQLLSSAHNVCEGSRDATAHAEMEAFRRAGLGMVDGRRALVLVSTLEPCEMCLGAAWEMGVDTVVFGLPAPGNGGSTRLASDLDAPPLPRLIGGISAAASRRLLEAWQHVPGHRHRPSSEAFVGRLLAQQQATRARAHAPL